MDKGPSIKAKIFSVILVLAATAVFIAAGVWQMSIYEKYKSCTSEVTGTVVRESFGKIYDDDEAKSKYVTSENWVKIEVESGSGFKLDSVYTNRGSAKEHDKITIYYDPNDPDNYCVGSSADYHKTTAVIIFALSGVLPLFLIFIMIKSARYYKALERQQNKYIYFNTPYCTFYFDESENVGYEGGVEWKTNPAGVESCAVFFETDSSKAPPKNGYYGLVEKYFLGKEENDHNINKLAEEIPELRDILPGECYRRLDKLLSDKWNTDKEIRKIVADHFLFIHKLNRDDLSETEIMKGLELAYITVCRNGDTVYEIYTNDIYISDLSVVIKADGSKEIHYKAAGENGMEEQCDVV